MKTFAIRYKSTNYYFIDTQNGLLAFDAGWPDTYGEYKDCLKAEGYRIDDIRWLIVSHFHIDHAGLAGMLADKGITFYVFKNQLYGIDEMESLMERKSIPHQKITPELMHQVEISESRKILKSMGISGEVIQTNGHGEQSVTLLLDTGEAFIGDLPVVGMYDEDDKASIKNWEEVRAKGARIIKPAHALEFILDQNG